MKRILILLSFLLIFVACQKEKEQTAINPRDAFLLANPDLDEGTKQSILNGEVNIGMTEAQVLASIGEPAKKEIFTSEFNSYKRWIYSNKLHIYWLDGKVDKLRSGD